MSKFNLKEHIAKNKSTFFSTLTEDMGEIELPALDMNQMMNVAQQVAKRISTSTTQFTVHPDSVEAFPNGGGFDLDHPEGEYEGGSYVVVPEEGKHKIYNAATGNEYVGFVSPQGEVVFDGVYEIAKPDALVNKPEDSAVDEELTEAYVPSNIKEFAKRKGVSSLVNKVAGWAEKVGKGIRGGTAIGYNYSTLILDMTFEGSEIRINTVGRHKKLHGNRPGNCHILGQRRRLEYHHVRARGERHAGTGTAEKPFGFALIERAAAARKLTTCLPPTSSPTPRNVPNTSCWWTSGATTSGGCVNSAA